MININNISFSYGKNKIFENFSLKISSGQRICLYGESGCGKTTLIRLILGLLKVESGNIEISHTLKPSVVFQENLLLPFKTILENLTIFGAQEDIALKNLKALGIGETANLYPKELSGGMQRRVAIARALSVPFDFLILDEPFTGLDEENIKITVKRILEILKDKPLILITHSQLESELLKAKIVKI